MSRPEDIPQDVWDAADEAASGFFGTGLTRIIARAIQAAKAEAYEEAAKVISDNMLCTGPDGSELFLPRGTSGNRVGLAYANAIRKLGIA